MILDIPYNFHWVIPGDAARSAQAYAGFLGSFLNAHGIRTMMNLRGANPGRLWWRREISICTREGVVHRDAKLNSRQLPTSAMLIELLDAFDSAPRPLLLKCSGGQDRTSFAAALYLVHRQGWQVFEDAEKQFALWPYLHRPRQDQRWLKLFLAFGRDQAAATPLRHWIERSYSQNEFRFWLEARGEQRSFHGLYDVPGSSDSR